MSDRISARAKKLGELLKTAREHAERSPAECAQVLDITEEEYEQVEMGEYLISLPDLESLAIYFDVPMGFFWGTMSLDNLLSHVDYKNMIHLRHRLIGGLLRQRRLDERRTQKDLAEAIGVERKVIRDYESGKVSIPYPYLEQLSQELGVSVGFFVDDEHGPLRTHEAGHTVRTLFHQMSPEIQDFLLNPINVSYLEAAWRLSEMETEKLRRIAESLLDITF